MFSYLAGMKKALAAIVFAVGVATGCFVTWVHSYVSERSTDKRVPTISALLKSAGVDIARDACDARLGRTVGDVLGRILDAGLHSGRNPYWYYCTGSTCRFSVGNCMPWQDTECGGTVLEFEVDAHGVPRPGTFSCIDVP
jgi:hypothetical protein